MASSRPSITKRNREAQRRENKLNKAQRQAERAAERAARPKPAEGEDPDIAGIVPGPQPPLED